MAQKLANQKITDKQYRELRRELKRLIEAYGMSEVVKIVHILAIVDFENRRP